MLYKYEAVGVVAEGCTCRRVEKVTVLVSRRLCLLLVVVVGVRRPRLLKAVIVVKG